MTSIEFRHLSKLCRAISFFEGHYRKSGLSFYAFICEREDREDEPWEVHTFSTGMHFYCKYHFNTLNEANKFVSDYLF